MSDNTHNTILKAAESEFGWQLSSWHFYQLGDTETDPQKELNTLVLHLAKAIRSNQLERKGTIPHPIATYECQISDTKEGEGNLTVKVQVDAAKRLDILGCGYKVASSIRK